MAFVDQLCIGQVWENRTNKRQFVIKQIHRKDKCCEVYWSDLDRHGIMLFQIMKEFYDAKTMYV